MALSTRPLLQIVFVATWLSFCHSRAGRNVDPPYPLSFHIDQVAGSARTHGPRNSTGVGPGKFYSTLTLHNDVLFIGGKSELFSARPDNLTTINNVSIQQSTLTNIVCESCDGNYIRIIQPLSDDILLECGTDGNSPYCQQRRGVDLSPVGSAHRFSGEANVAPSAHNQNSSWLFLLDTADATYHIFAGTYLANSFGDLEKPAIAKALLRTSPEETVIDIKLKTKSNPQKVLNGPQFVGKPIDYNGRIYFFYREFASEHINAGRIIFSRVAMICKEELGGKSFSTYTEDQLVTFAKARLNCAIPGNFPYHYNEIQDIYQSTIDPSVVFAVFATGPTGVASSAVCAYRLDEIEAQFQNSHFRAKRADWELWIPLIKDPVVPRPATSTDEVEILRSDPAMVRRAVADMRRRCGLGNERGGGHVGRWWCIIQCPNTATYSDAAYGRILRLAQLMKESAKTQLHYDRGHSPRRRHYPDYYPLLVTHGERFTQIVIDEKVNNSTDVMFIGTENCTVLKAYLNGDRSQARIVEEISLTTEEIKSPVLTMTKDAQAVFVGTDTGVFKVPLQHCQDYATCYACLDARDPYCKWLHGSCRTSSRSGLQDLVNGSSELCTSKTNESVIIHRKPWDQWRAVKIANQPFTVYLLAESAETSNVRVVDVECDLCGLLSFTQFKSSFAGREFLMLSINASHPHANFDCSCHFNLEVDGRLEEFAPFKLKADNSAKVNASAEDSAELSEFDLKIQEYKYELRSWKLRLTRSCGLDELQDCQSEVCRPLN